MRFATWASSMRDLGYTEQQQYALLADTLGQPGMGALVAAGGGPADPVAQTLQLWEPVLAGAAQIASGNADTATQEEVYGLLDNLSATDDWSALVAVLRRIIDGERSTELLTGLDHRVDTAIATELLNRLQ
ncbi:MAG: hypothetical protein IPG68_09145 [Micrococcales bacterium]|nr:hypothetical protein [Micrococcales bacterium]